MAVKLIVLVATARTDLAEVSSKLSFLTKMDDSCDYATDSSHDLNVGTRKENERKRERYRKCYGFMRK